jgi:hypothetical protein
MKIRVGSKRALLIETWLACVVGAVLAGGAMVGLYALGVGVTPEDSGGHPQVFSPSVRATELYCQKAGRWVERMAEMDRRLTALLDEGATPDAMALHAQSQEMQAIGEEAAALVRETSTTAVPVAMVGLQERVRTAADAYLQVSLATARWLGAPSAAERRKALEALRAARALRIELEASRWLTES